MKRKTKIASFGVIIGFAALPVAGVFAVDGDGTMSFSDTVKATVQNSCGIYDAYTSASSNTPVANTNGTDVKTYAATIALGDHSEINGSSVMVVCNDTAGWTVSAVGAGAGTTVAHMDASTDASDDLATGTTFTGTAGMWGFKIASVGSGASIETGYNDYAEVPTSAATVISAAGATDKISGAFQTKYKVYIGTETPAATYTGKVTYTLAHPAPAQQQEPQEG